MSGFAVISATAFAYCLRQLFVALALLTGSRTAASLFVIVRVVLARP